MYFVINGEPEGKRRPRFTMIHGYAQAVKDRRDVEYEGKVRAAYTGEKYDGAVSVRIVANFGVPKSYTKKMRDRAISGEIVPVKKPDADNIEKIICDALNGVAYRDDAQVVDIRTTKRYAVEGSVEVWIDAYKKENMGGQR